MAIDAEGKDFANPGRCNFALNNPVDGGAQSYIDLRPETTDNEMWQALTAQPDEPPIQSAVD